MRLALALRKCGTPPPGAWGALGSACGAPAAHAAPGPAPGTPAPLSPPAPMPFSAPRPPPPPGASGGNGRGGNAATGRISSSPGNSRRSSPGVRSGRRPVMRGYTSSRK